MVRVVRGATVGAVLLLGPSAWVRLVTRGRLYRAGQRVPNAPVALVLGARVLPDGTPSTLLRRRLDQAARLLTHGTVQTLLLSGDGGERHSDEVTVMRRYLLGRGVPRSALLLDRAGFETWDSCVRARRVFGVERAIVVTQRFHLPRAVALARRAGIDAYGVADDSAYEAPRATAVGAVREVAATVKAIDTLLRRPDPARLDAPDSWVADALVR